MSWWWDWSRAKRLSVWDGGIVDFECSIGDMAAFIKSSESRKSEFFFFNNLPWSIQIEKKRKTVRGATEASDYLAVYLRADSFADSPACWSTNVNYSVKLLNQRWADLNRGFSFDNIQFSHHSQRWGLNELISTNQLRSDGFIEQDQIRFRILLRLPNPEPASSSRRPIAFAL